MSSVLFSASPSFISSTKKKAVSIIPLTAKKFKSWEAKQTKALQTQISEEDFTAKPGQTLLAFGKDGTLSALLLGVASPAQSSDFSAAASVIEKAMSPNFIKKAVFEIETTHLKPEEQTAACIGWGLSAYRFDRYKNSDSVAPRLLWPKEADKKRAQTLIEGICLIRTLINTPANDMGPEELEQTARALAEQHGLKIKVTKGAALEKGFPLIHTVGKASPRAARLIEITAGAKDAPLVTLVGKGVCFDTGGLNLKPTGAMSKMKKDMGGAAHVLALAHILLAIKCPVRVRVLIPAVDNDVSGGAYRPGDILPSRKGLTVENTNTDAEGRLVLADALTYGCEDAPDLLIDFATLTGSAMAALGNDIAALFSNNDKLAKAAQKLAQDTKDPVWAMPLWQPYSKLIESPVADLVNSARVPGDLIYSALFLESFIDEKTDWIHLDIYGWQDTAKPGRPQGGTDHGLLTMLALLEERYAS